MYVYLLQKKSGGGWSKTDMAAPQRSRAPLFLLAALPGRGLLPCVHRMAAGAPAIMSLFQEDRGKG